MQHLPLFVALRGKPCLVLGGGPVAARKAGLLLRAGAEVLVIAPHANRELRALHDSGRIELRQQPYAPSQLAGQWLVIAATDDDRLNAAVAQDAERQGVLCNAVDNLEASGFILPAIVDRAPVTIAIGTGGHAPVLAQKLKSRLEAWLPVRIGELAERAGQWRTVVRKRYERMADRRRFWQRFFDGPVAGHLLAGRRTQADAAMRRELIAPLPEPGTGEGYIVGAGPGDPGLLTLRAQQLLAHADVVLYDRLVAAEVLDMARKEAELICVGKQSGTVTMPQADINTLLVQQVRAGKRVCRLKGGDPFVFGRGGEEAQALAAAGLPFQIVPGVSAAFGCAAYAGIPLTLRGVSASVTLATARLDDGRHAEWSRLARAGDTLALYMSVGALAQTTAQLARHGVPRDTPAALVASGTTAAQQVLHSTLSEIAADAVREGIEAPAMLFIGASVGAARDLQWFESAQGTGSGFGSLDVPLQSVQSA